MQRLVAAADGGVDGPADDLAAESPESETQNRSSYRAS